jgi:hypothetical protein
MLAIYLSLKGISDLQYLLDVRPDLCHDDSIGAFVSSSVDWAWKARSQNVTLQGNPNPRQARVNSSAAYASQLYLYISVISTLSWCIQSPIPGFPVAQVKGCGPVTSWNKHGTATLVEGLETYSRIF